MLNVLSPEPEISVIPTEQTGPFSRFFHYSDCKNVTGACYACIKHGLLCFFQNRTAAMSSEADFAAFKYVKRGRYKSSLYSPNPSQLCCAALLPLL